jgi:hypothetical protein
MFDPWRLWDNTLFRLLQRCLHKRCQTDQWPLYDSFSLTQLFRDTCHQYSALSVSKQHWPTARFLTVALLVLRIIWNAFSPLVILVCTLVWSRTENLTTAIYSSALDGASYVTWRTGISVNRGGRTVHELHIFFTVTIYPPTEELINKYNK